MNIILKIICDNKNKRWNDIVKSFNNWDVYYLYEYAYSFELHGDGKPLLVYFEHDDERLCYVVMQKDIYESNLFGDKIKPLQYFDWETPYGYGGPLVPKSISNKNQVLFLKELLEYCNQNKVVSQFVRFHPVLDNYNILPIVIESRFLRETIYIDTTDLEKIFKNMDSKNRNMVRKAEKNHVTIQKCEITELESFIDMYNETMLKNGADDYYIFNTEYFKSLKLLKDNACVFYAMLDSIPIAASIILYNSKYVHYHLSGSHTEYRKYSPTNLLLYEVAKWANKNGMEKFHLGGGMNPNDSLFGFKKQFNKNGHLPFVVGRTIFNQEKYNRLLNFRCELDEEFDKNNSFMIQYRR